MSKEYHQWVKFSNPRNERLRTVACKRCGLTKSLVFNELHCKPQSPEVVNVRMAGWVHVKSEEAV